MFASILLGSPPDGEQWNRSTSTARHTKMEPIDMDGFEREGTAELVNDPRFCAENVIDKRLEAFEALAIVTELLSAVAIKECFEMPKDFKLLGPCNILAIAQLFGFSLLVFVLFIATVATATLSLQLFFTIRLLTAGPTGFDKASRFYSDKRMWRWRERAIFGVKFGLVNLIIATGYMLFVKFWSEGVREKTLEHDELKERTAHKIAAIVIWAVFMVCTGILAWLVKTHQRVFDESYSSVDQCHPMELQSHLNRRLA